MSIKQKNKANITRPNRNNNGYFALRHFSPVCKSLPLIERVSIECRKSKTKVITLANSKGWRQSNKPGKTRSNYTWPTHGDTPCGMSKLCASNKAGLSYTGSEIINVHKTKEQSEHNKA